MQKALLRNQRINLVEKEWKESREYLKHNLQKNDFLCPQCKEPVGLHWAIPTKKTPHFKHRSKKDCTYGLGESEEHNAGKVKLFNYFNTVFANKLERIDIEHFIQETKQIADIYLQFKTGEKWVIEYQRSNIPIQDIQRRRALYKSLNIKDIWIAGENLVRSDDLVTVNLLNAAHELTFEDFDQTQSLITFDPVSEQVAIYRGLEQLNQNSFMKNAARRCLLNELCFNRWGEPFVFEDYLQVDERRNIDVPEGMALTYSVKEMIFANKIDKTYYQINGEIYLSIPEYLHSLIPLEMENLEMSFLWNNRPANSAEEDVPMTVTGLYTSRWGAQIEERQRKEIEVSTSPVALGMLFTFLNITYDHCFMTEKEREKEIELMLNGKQIPYYVQNQYLKRIGAIDQDILRTQFKNPVNLSEASYYLLRIMGVRSGLENPVKEALARNILDIEEIEQPFTLGLLVKMEERARSYLGMRSKKTTTEVK